MAQGHSVDEYLETIYFLAFPIGEYRPLSGGSPTLASRVAEMLGVSRASAGEMLKRLEAEGLIERGEHKEALLTAAGTRSRTTWSSESTNASAIPIGVRTAGRSIRPPSRPRTTALPPSPTSRRAGAQRSSGSPSTTATCCTGSTMRGWCRVARSRYV